MTDRQPPARRPRPLRQRDRRFTGRVPGLARPFLAKLVAGCVCMTVAGCNAMSRPDRHPIDGLRLIDNDEVSAAESSGDIGELKRLDLRI